MYASHYVPVSLINFALIFFKFACALFNLYPRYQVGRRFLSIPATILLTNCQESQNPGGYQNEINVAQTEVKLCLTIQTFFRKFQKQGKRQSFCEILKKKIIVTIILFWFSSCFIILWRHNGITSLNIVKFLEQEGLDIFCSRSCHQTQNYRVQNYLINKMIL